MKKKRIYISVSVISILCIILGLSLGIYYGVLKDNLTDDSHTLPLTAGIFNPSGELTASWQDLESESKIIVEEGVLIKCDTTLSGKLVLPQDANITKIGFQAFKYCTSLEEVILPEGLTTIDKDGFISCLALKKINIPSTVESIKLDAFYNCQALEEVVIPTDSSLKEIAYGAFTYCFKLRTLFIPSTVTMIDESAFLGCKSLDNIVLPASVTSVPSHLFKDCENLSTITYENVEEISPYAFYNCKKLITFDFSKIKKIGESAFYGSGLVQVVLSEDLISLDKQAFQNCYNLKTVEFKGATVELNTSIFEECILLERVILPSELNRIPDYTFFGCESLKELFIPEHVTWIGRFAFKDCISLSLTFASKASWAYSKTPDFKEFTYISFFSVDTSEEIIENKKKLIDGLEDHYFKIIDEEITE